MKTTLAFCLFALVASSAYAAAGAPTYIDDVRPILQANCAECHRAAGANVMGMVAPMSFSNFAEVRPWAKAIARNVEDRTMPPWHASADFDGVFVNQRSLAQGEIDTIVRWASQGASRGEGEEPAADTADRGWQIGEPDLIVPFEEAYFVADDVEDQYATVVVNLTEEQMPEDRWIEAMEFRPGSEAVHHIVIFTDDARESLGFPSMGERGMLGGMGPGTDATVFPDGYGRSLRKTSSIMFNMHYHKEPGPGTGVSDLSQIAFKFHDAPVEHPVNWGAVGTFNFSIPPHAEKHEVMAEQTIERDIVLMSLFPHTHLRGTASQYTAFYPDGTQEVLLDVPKYDFNWQTNYIYREPKQLPAGTKLQIRMWYDNSEARAAYTGIDPTRTVGYGQPTTDGMMFGFIDYTWGDAVAPASTGGP